MKTWVLTTMWPVIQPLLVPVISGVVVQLLKLLANGVASVTTNAQIQPYLPILSGLIGAVIGAVQGDGTAQASWDQILQGATGGVVGGLAATGAHQVVKQQQQKKAA